MLQGKSTGLNINNTPTPRSIFAKRAKAVRIQPTIQKNTETSFQRFSYSVLKTLTNGFSKEIGRGGGGVVYRGTFDDYCVAAVKCLNEAHQGETKFLA